MRMQVLRERSKAGTIRLYRSGRKMKAGLDLGRTSPIATIQDSPQADPAYALE
jgi:hypothetical protein